MSAVKVAASGSIWLLPFGVTLVAMFTLQLSNLGFAPLLPSIQVRSSMAGKSVPLP